MISVQSSDRGRPLRGAPTRACWRPSPPTSARRSRTPGCTRRRSAVPTRWRRSPTSAGRSRRPRLLDRSSSASSERGHDAARGRHRARCSCPTEDRRRSGRRRPGRHRRGGHGRTDRAGRGHHRQHRRRGAPPRSSTTSRAIRGRSTSRAPRTTPDERLMAAPLSAAAASRHDGRLAVGTQRAIHPGRSRLPRRPVASRPRSRSTTRGCSPTPARPAQRPSRPTRPRARSWPR